jgi:ribokinase
MTDICVVGGINMDLMVQVPHLPRPGETVQGGGVVRFPGGKGSNQAVAASRLGADVGLVGQVGADAFGDELIVTLKAAGVETAGVRQVSGAPTGVALISVAPDGQNAIVVAPGANLAWDGTAVSDAERTAAGCRLLVANLEVSPAVVARAIRAARRTGAQVILNPAPHRPGDDACFGAVDLLVPNQVEAALYAGVEPDAVREWGEIGRRLLGLGPGAVIITLGAEGSVIVTDEAVTRVPSFQVPVVDSTAAGDAFVGGLAVAVLQGLKLPEAVRYANACGAIAVTRAGAQPCLPHGAEVERLLARGERS